MDSRIKVLVSEEEIEKRINELAAEIAVDFSDKPFTMICILKGAVIFMVDLAKKLRLDLEFDFMEISSYGESTQSSGIIKINKDLQQSITGKHVLLIEDIIDSGRTLSALKKHLLSQHPTDIKICTLLDKPERRVVDDVVPDYIGFMIPDAFVVGYGLDYQQKYRNLPYIGVLPKELI